MHLQLCRSSSLCKFNFIGLQLCRSSSLCIFNFIGLQLCVSSTLSVFNSVFFKFVASTLSDSTLSYSTLSSSQSSSSSFPHSKLEVCKKKNVICFEKNAGIHGTMVFAGQGQKTISTHSPGDFVMSLIACCLKLCRITAINLRQAVVHTLEF
jgi:hypothetical protein